MNRLRKKIIMFLVRRKLKLKKNECFRFVGQKSKTDFYYFTDTSIEKVMPHADFYTCSSNVSLNYLLCDDCKITKTGKFE